MSEDSEQYQRFASSLLFLNSAADIRNAVRSTAGIRIDRLVAAFDALEQSLLEEGRSEENELLTFVREALNDDLQGVTRSATLTIENPELLWRAALQLPSILRMRTLLQQHRSYVTDQFVQQMLLEAASPATSDPQLLKLFVAAALINGASGFRTQAYMLWGSDFRRRGDLKRAERWLMRSTRAARESGDSKLISMARLGQISLYRATRDLEKAMSAMEEALEAAIAEHDNPIILTLRKGMAQCANERGQYEKALDSWNEAVALLRSMGFASTEQMTSALQSRGLVKENLGRYEQGFLDYQEAFELAQATGDRDAQFIAMNNMAASFTKRGLAREGLRRFRETLRIVTTWGNTPMEASTHNNIGNLLLTLNRPAEALTEFGKALSFKIGFGTGRGEAIAFLGLGDAERKLGQKKNAQMWYALALMNGLQTGDVGVISMYASRLDSADDEGDEDGQIDQIENLEWALRLARADREKFFEITLTEALGKLYLKQGDKQKAIDIYRSIVEDSSVDGSSSPQLLEARLEYARLLADDPSTLRKAFNLLTQSLTQTETELREIVYDERRAEIVTDAIKLYGGIIALLLEHGESPVLSSTVSHKIQAFDLHEAAKSRSFLSGLSDAPAEPPPNVPLELVEREAGLLTLERSYQDATEVKSEAFRAQRLSEIRRDLHQCWEEMKRFATDYVRFRLGEPYSWQELSSKLTATGGTRAAFVSFFCEESSTTAFLLKPGQSEPSVYRCGLGEEELRKVVSRLRRSFNGAPTEFPPYPPILRDRPFRRSLDFLTGVSDQLLQFLPDVEDVELLCIAPHGPLHLLPFQALRTSTGDYLASRHPVVYTPSLSTAVQILARSGEKHVRAPAVLVAGTSAAEDIHPEFFEQDAEIFDKQTLQVSSRIGVQQTSRAEILGALADFQVIHLSCHGYFEESNPLNSGLLLSDGYCKPPRNPWSISVMERQRFLITVRDLRRVHLRADLVTLNACSTGLQGQRNAGDELDGFSRALLLSGASAVLLALWNVDQQSSLDFLRIFYGHWLGKNKAMPKWKALQLAQQEFLSSGDEFLRHPYHWAPFALTGDWR